MTTQEVLAATGVGLLSFNSLKTVVKAAKAIHNRTPAAIPLAIYDDGSFSANARWARAWAQAAGRDAVALLSEVNRGAAHSRNGLLEHFESRGMRFVATVDADIEVKSHWLVELARVMAEHDDCGIATWAYCNDHGGKFPVRGDGAVAETASMCWLWRLDAVDAALGPDVVWGMDERLPLLSHDSEFCQRMKRCSEFRTFVSDRDLMTEIERSHSTGGASKTISKQVHARRALDNVIWAELEAARGWEEGKEEVGPCE